MRDYGTTNNTPSHQATPVWRVPEGLEDLTAAQVGDGGTSAKQKSHAIHKHK